MRILFSTFATAALILAAVGARASTICVNPGGTGGCLGSVQSAIGSASAGDVVDVAAGTYAEAVAVPPSLRQLTIQGAGVGLTIIDGSGSPSAPVVTLGDTSSGGPLRVALRGFTIQLGPQIGILVDGASKTDAAIEDVELSGSVAYPSVGIQVGETSHKGGKATIQRAKIDHVGIALAATSAAKVTFVDSEISDTGPGGFLSNISGLLAEQRGRIDANRVLLARIEGPVLVAATGGKISLTSSTVSSNHTTHGSIARTSAGSIKVVGCTIAQNEADFVLDAGGKIALAATIVWANTTAGFGDCSGNVTSGDYNIVSAGCSLAHPRAHDAAGIDPLLGPLANNGGPTYTHALLSSSPALGDVLSRSLCKAPDQRGTTRAVPCDVGAFEGP
jgi:hypothetical protein